MNPLRDTLVATLHHDNEKTRTNQRTRVMRRYLLVFLLLALLFASLRVEGHRDPGQTPGQGTAQRPVLMTRWYKGNTHTHTLNSDGDSTPDEVVRWYREHGYQFLTLTDHNFLTSVDGLNALHGADEKFLVMRGEEVTDDFGGKPIHINGLDVKTLVPPQGGTSVVDTIQRNVDAIRKAAGIPHINHPNFHWAMTPDELRQVQRTRLLEIFNGHPTVNNEGGGASPSLEEVWDFLLSNGKLIYGIAVDDAHTFKQPWARDAARPGQGWVYVSAEKLSSPAILDALERGEFYASTGVELRSYQSDDKTITLTLKADRFTRHRVQFIGKGGRILKEELGNSATYQIKGDEGYVRSRVIDSNGGKAWTQPVVVEPR